MSDQQNTQTQGMTIQLEVVPEDEEQEDICHTRHKMAAKNGITWPRPEIFTLTLPYQNPFRNGNSWPKVQKSGINWPEGLFV